MSVLQNSTAKFSLDRPFGIYLNDYFVQTYTLTTGNDPNDFAFTEGITPFATIYEVAIAIITYFAVIFGGQQFMKNYSPISLKFIFQFHNLLLTLISLVLLVLFAEQLIPVLLRNGLFYSVCDTDAWTQRLELLYYINYLVKFWELADTMFLVLRKKNLEFLHVYHHSMTVALCFSQLDGRTSVSWVPITLNLLVHVFMYYYYFRAAGGARIWWKKYLTTMQITQFIIDLCFVYFCSYTYFSATYWDWLPNAGLCAGSEGAAIFGCSLLSSYLFLFIAFYKKTYSKKKVGVDAKKQNTGKI